MRGLRKSDESGRSRSGGSSVRTFVTERVTNCQTEKRGNQKKRRDRKRVSVCEKVEFVMG